MDRSNVRALLALAREIRQTDTTTVAGIDRDYFSGAARGLYRATRAVYGVTAAKRLERIARGESGQRLLKDAA
jgi:hypothetical protein